MRIERVRCMRDERKYDLVAAAVAAGAAGFELVRTVAAGGTPGHTTLSAVIGATLFCSMLAVSGIGLALHRRFGWAFGVAGMLSLLAHGIIIRAGGNVIGGVYIALGLVMFYCLARSLQYYRDLAPDRV
jgi:hypothetical protein